MKDSLNQVFTKIFLLHFLLALYFPTVLKLPSACLALPRVIRYLMNLGFKNFDWMKGWVGFLPFLHTRVHAQAHTSTHASPCVQHTRPRTHTAHASCGPPGSVCMVSLLCVLLTLRTQLQTQPGGLSTGGCCALSLQAAMAALMVTGTTEMAASCSSTVPSGRLASSQQRTELTWPPWARVGCWQPDPFPPALHAPSACYSVAVC